MKKQIIRFSPHQNAKVFAILMTVSSLVFFVPIIGIQMATMPSHDGQGNPIDFPYMMFAIFPVFYLVFGYISVAIGCWIYNKLSPKIGGIEYEAVETNE